MLPIQLIIEGLYSYQSKQTIDFSTLTESGLFGIFGGVGSGKSSILEAISLALYGETERLNSRDSRGYNMLNLKSDKVYIEFEFSNFEKRIFKFTVSWKRKKKFEETTPMERLAYEWINGQWIPMESADATLVLGLTYENFRRTIIIPQGKFKEFLELKGAERSKMMKEIFNLERFDLSIQVSNLQRENNLKIEHLKGILSGFETVTAEGVQQQQSEVETAQQRLMLLKTDFEVVEIEWKALQEAQLKFEELNKKKREYSELVQQKPSIDQLQADILQFEVVESAFKELINRQKTWLSEEQQHLKTKEDVRSDQVKLSNAIENQNQLLEKWQVAYDLLDSQKQKVLDLHGILLLADLKTNLREQKSALDKGTTFVKEQQKTEEELKNRIKEKEAHLEELKAGRIDASQWLEIGNWYQNQAFLKRQGDVLETKRLANISDIELLLADFLTLNVTPDHWETTYIEKNERLAQQIAQHNQSITTYSVAVELSRFSTNLHDGEACPLCGSLEHPQIAHHEDVSEQLALAMQSKSELEEELKKVQKQQAGLQKGMSNYEFLIGQKQILQGELSALENQKKTHLEAFKWTDFTSDNPELFESEKENAKVLEEKIKSEEEAIKALREAEGAIQERTQKAIRKINLIELEVSGLEGQCNQVVKQIKTLQIKDYEEMALEAIADEKKALETENELVEKTYKLALEKIQELKPQLATKMGILQTVEGQLDYIKANRQLLDQEIEKTLKQQQLNTMDEVLSILSKSWNIEQEKQRISQFQFQLQRTIQIIEELQLQTENWNDDPTLYVLKQQQYRQLQADLEQAIGQMSALEQELRRIQKALEQKQEWIEEANKLDLRAANLTTMTNLFKGSGFVNYVSSIYLQNLCDVANVRFQRLTRNQLSLKLNENNEFEVLDYLNNGYARSVKTLSGGQGFQASLCLALALAESIQALNKADKNFFFIDEGFGTQDAESINTVFETLQYLHKENRVVGIISHVEELQERIPSSITVIKNEEKGSFVVVD